MSTPMSGVDTLDVILQECGRFGLYAIEDRIWRTAVRVGPFLFRWNRHDTGCDVKIDICHGGEQRNILSTTYWYSSSYTFNREYRESGVWDAALDEAIRALRDAVGQARAADRARLIAESAAKEDAAAAERARWEALFTSPAEPGARGTTGE